jgi:hypothetical protein
MIFTSLIFIICVLLVTALSNVHGFTFLVFTLSDQKMLSCIHFTHHSERKTMQVYFSINILFYCVLNLIINKFKKIIPMLHRGENWDILAAVLGKEEEMEKSLTSIYDASLLSEEFYNAEFSADLM